MAEWSNGPGRDLEWYDLEECCKSGHDRRKPGLLAQWDSASKRCAPGSAIPSRPAIGTVIRILRLWISRRRNDSIPNRKRNIDFDPPQTHKQPLSGKSEQTPSYAHDTTLTTAARILQKQRLHARADSRRCLSTTCPGMHEKEFRYIDILLQSFLLPGSPTRETPPLSNNGPPKKGKTVSTTA